MDGVTPQRTKARIFEPFFTTKERGTGTGLGLPMVFGIVKQSGGYIAVYSEPTHGTTFKIYFPRVGEASVLPTSDVPRAAPAGGTETVLVVEDEATVRHLAACTLRSQGDTVVEASNGKEALLVFDRHEGPIHFVLTDVIMPEMSGRELSEKLLVRRPDLKILFMSGYTNDAVVRHGVSDAEQHQVVGGRLAGAIRLEAAAVLMHDDAAQPRDVVRNPELERNR
ncbi:MAG: hypothetical protein C0483_14775 [Pirellula sp.]|nr:hypothetical protein [Pirellula sp.]